MITHYIIMSSSYSKGTRIALDFIVDGNERYDELKGIFSRIMKECGEDVSISTHFIDTDSKTWKSVVNYDHFFKDVEIITNVDKFIKLIKKDRTLKGIDVARYITSKIQCTHLKLEKLVYLCYADYLCEYGKKLYQDEIYAFKYGPVVDSVYKKYKKYGYREIDEDEKNILDTVTSLELPYRSRILFAENGVEKLKSIEETLKKYGKLTAGMLVALTHKDSTPWSLTKQSEKKFEKIEDEIIKEYHINESV